MYLSLRLLVFVCKYVCMYMYKNHAVLAERLHSAHINGCVFALQFHWIALDSVCFRGAAYVDTRVARRSSREISNVIFHHYKENSSRNLDRRLGERSWEELGGAQRVKGHEFMASNLPVISTDIEQYTGTP